MRKITLLIVVFILLSSISFSLVDNDNDGYTEDNDQRYRHDECQYTRLGERVDRNGCSCTQKIDEENRDKIFYCPALDDNNPDSRCMDRCGTLDFQVRCNVPAIKELTDTIIECPESVCNRDGSLTLYEEGKGYNKCVNGKVEGFTCRRIREIPSHPDCRRETGGAAEPAAIQPEAQITAPARSEDEGYERLIEIGRQLKEEHEILSKLPFAAQKPIPSEEEHYSFTFENWEDGEIIELMDSLCGKGDWLMHNQLNRVYSCNFNNGNELDGSYELAVDLVGMPHRVKTYNIRKDDSLPYGYGGLYNGDEFVLSTPRGIVEGSPMEDIKSSLSHELLHSFFPYGAQVYGEGMVEAVAIIINHKLNQKIDGVGIFSNYDSYNKYGIAAEDGNFMFEIPEFAAIQYRVAASAWIELFAYDRNFFRSFRQEALKRNNNGESLWGIQAIKNIASAISPKVGNADIRQWFKDSYIFTERPKEGFTPYAFGTTYFIDFIVIDEKLKSLPKKEDVKVNSKIIDFNNNLISDRELALTDTRKFNLFGENYYWPEFFAPQDHRDNPGRYSVIFEAAINKEVISDFVYTSAFTWGSVGVVEGYDSGNVLLANSNDEKIELKVVNGAFGFEDYWKREAFKSWAGQIKIIFTSDKGVKIEKLKYKLGESFFVVLKERKYCPDGTLANNCNQDGLYCGHANRIPNSGFEIVGEDGIPDFFTKDPHPYIIIGKDVLVDSSKSYAGKNSIKITKQWASFDTGKIGLEPNTDYVFTARVAGTCNAYRLFSGASGEGAYRICDFGKCELAGEGEWKQFRAEFNSNNLVGDYGGYIESLRVECGDGMLGQPYMFWIDAMSLEKADEAPALRNNCGACGCPDGKECRSSGRCETAAIGQAVPAVKPAVNPEDIIMAVNLEDCNSLSDGNLKDFCFDHLANDIKKSEDAGRKRICALIMGQRRDALCSNKFEYFTKEISQLKKEYCFAVKPQTFRKIESGKADLASKEVAATQRAGNHDYDLYELKYYGVIPATSSYQPGIRKRSNRITNVWYRDYDGIIVETDELPYPRINEIKAIDSKNKAFSVEIKSNIFRFTRLNLWYPDVPYANIQEIMNNQEFSYCVEVDGRQLNPEEVLEIEQEQRSILQSVIDSARLMLSRFGDIFRSADEPAQEGIPSKIKEPVPREPGEGRDI